MLCACVRWLVLTATPTPTLPLDGLVGGTGEILGCTSPKLDACVTHIIYVGDGRFHLESIMIHNPHVAAMCYNPYDRRLTREEYDTHQMHRMRRAAIAEASES